MNHEANHQEEKKGLKGSRLIFLGFLGIAAFFLITEHRAHLFGILPFLLLLACPLMHFFHGGHGGHGGHRHGGTDEPPSNNKPEGQY